MADDKKEPEFVPTPMDPSKEDPELKALLNDLAEGKEGSSTIETKPIVADPKQLEAITPTPILAKDEGEQQLSAFARKFTDVANEILDNFKSDREQVNDTIEYLENIVLNGAGQRVHVEALVASLRTKAETNASAVKVLDSLAKFLAATKGTNVFVQNNHTTIQDDLAAILAKGPYLDEIKKQQDAKD